ncbi:MAG: SdpI family protein [Clostridia bacterium]|nr:SdpI family protein [Clostridia bacterium]
MNTKNNNYSLISTIKREWYLLAILLITFIIGIYVYPDLPTNVPSHWNIHGEIDGWSSKTFAVIFYPLLNLILYPLMLIFPKLDPRSDNYSRFAGAYKAIRIFLHLFLAFIYLLTLVIALGYPIKMDIIVRASISILFILIGNYMGKFQHNYFVGIKTPWTLANEQVWRKTHRLAAPLWVGVGTIEFFLSFFQGSWAGYTQFALFMLMAFIPIIYSYFAYRNLNKS